jgi:hypothetical protein
VSDEFTCEHCGRTYEKAWSDEEARAEMDVLFRMLSGRVPESVLCDECHADLLEWLTWRTLGPDN